MDVCLVGESQDERVGSTIVEERGDCPIGCGCRRESGDGIFALLGDNAYAIGLGVLAVGNLNVRLAAYCKTNRAACLDVPTVGVVVGAVGDVDTLVVLEIPRGLGEVVDIVFALFGLLNRGNQSIELEVFLDLGAFGYLDTELGRPTTEGATFGNGKGSFGIFGGKCRAMSDGFLAEQIVVLVKIGDGVVLLVVARLYLDIRAVLTAIDNERIGCLDIVGPCSRAAVVVAAARLGVDRGEQGVGGAGGNGSGLVRILATTECDTHRAIGLETNLVICPTVLCTIV